MKKILISSALVAGVFISGAAFAEETTICNAATAAKDGTVPKSGTAGTHFMVSPIVPKCSANTQVVGMDGTSGAWYAVGANSAKGKTSYGGHSNGGGIASPELCKVPGGCTLTEAQTARTAANTAAGGAADAGDAGDAGGAGDAGAGGAG